MRGRHEHGQTVSHVSRQKKMYRYTGGVFPNLFLNHSAASQHSLNFVALGFAALSDSTSVWPWFTLPLQSDRQLLTSGGTPRVLDPKPSMSVLHSGAPDTYV